MLDAGKQPSSKQPKSKDSSRYVFETENEVQARRRTDERGYAVFRHFQFSRERQEKWWPEEHRDRFEAVLSMPLAAPVRACFEWGRALLAERGVLAPAAAAAGALAAYIPPPALY